MPFIFAAVIFVPLWLASFKDGDQKQVVIVDRTGLYAPLFRSNERFAFSVAPQITDSMRQAETDIDAVLYFRATSRSIPRPPSSIRARRCPLS